ncbi:transposase, partial [Acinetobacter sp. B10A]|uniref:transposase n=1 Tax=Acinetobacter baretiae TaxID=2605383 RepID=UPI001B3C94E1
FLIPELPQNSVIVMDNVAFHKRSDIQELLEHYGHQILWLPAYSPDLNSIEKTWAWIKKKRKEWQEDCIDRLFQMFFHFCMSN